MGPRLLTGVRALFAIALVHGLVPGTLVAQEAGEPTGDQRGRSVERAVAAIEPGSRLRITWDRGLSSEGTLLPASTVLGRLQLQTDTATIDVPYARIDSLWQQRSKAEDGAVLGGVAGAAAGALVLLGFAELTCEAVTCGGPSGKAWAVFVGGGAAVGTAVGALIGAEQSAWQLVVPQTGR